MLSTAAMAQRPTLPLPSRRRCLGCPQPTNRLSARACLRGAAAVSHQNDAPGLSGRYCGFPPVECESGVLHLEVPFAGVPNQSVSFSNGIDISTSHLSSVFITPRSKPSFCLGPCFAVGQRGGGWAHYSFPGDHTNKGVSSSAVEWTSSPISSFRLSCRGTGFPERPSGFGTEGGLSRHNVLSEADSWCTSSGRRRNRGLLRATRRPFLTWACKF